MKDEKKTRQQLLDELTQLRRENDEMRKSETETFRRIKIQEKNSWSARTV
jgi:hypothetical protein